MARGKQALKPAVREQDIGQALAKPAVREQHPAQPLARTAVREQDPAQPLAQYAVREHFSSVREKEIPSWRKRYLQLGKLFI
mgnify:CR=1 FL=1